MPMTRLPVRLATRSALRYPLSPAYGGAAAFNPATEFASGTTGAWFTADDNTYLKVNTDGTGGNVADGGMVGRWDDRSGNGNHLSKVTSTRGALWNASAQGLDYFHKITGGVLNSGMNRGALAVNLARANMTGGCVAWLPGTEQTAVVDHGTASSFSVMPGRRANLPSTHYFNGGSFTSTSLLHNARKCFLSWRNDGTTLSFYVDGVLYTGSGQTAVAMTALYTGQFAGGTPAPQRLRELVCFNSVFDDTKMAAFNAYLASRAGTYDTTRTVHVYGDSLSIGIGSETGVPWHFRPEVTSRPNSRWYCSAFGGAITTQQISTASLISSKGSAEGVVILWTGTNDVLSGFHTGAQWVTDMTNISTTLRAAGIKVIACTLQHFVTNDAQRIAGNAALVAASASFDAIVRLDTAPELDDATDTTYYTSDAVHLKDAGYAAAATLINAALASV